jgi:hypothetical protein
MQRASAGDGVFSVQLIAQVHEPFGHRRGGCPLLGPQAVIDDRGATCLNW